MPFFTEISSMTYPDYLNLKNILHKRRVDHKIENLWLFTSHSPGVYSYGRSLTKESILFPEDYIRKQGREIYEIERGGDITYHGPSQVMIYPFIEVPDHDVEHLVRNLERVIIYLLDIYGLESEPRKGFPGLWCNESKIASIGIAIRKWTTMHGVAFNHEKDDGGFEMIIPCGIKGVTMTSLEEQLERKIKRSEVVENLVNCLEDVFGEKLEHVDFKTLTAKE
jgi:lipoate-protein ligase B